MSQATQAVDHAIHWFEIPVTDLDRSTAFYEQVLGTTLRREHITGTDLAVFPGSSPEAVKGCLMRVDPAAPRGDGVLVYLNAGAAIAPVLQRVEAAGGQVVTPRTMLPPGMGCFAHFTDPDGQRVGLHALD